MSDRVYEILFIADPNLGEPEVDALTEHIQGFAEKEGGRIQKVEKWGKKRLARGQVHHRPGGRGAAQGGRPAGAAREGGGEAEAATHAAAERG